MKKLILTATFAVAGTIVSAQCTPNPIYVDSVYGVWPDTTANFAPAYLNEIYSDTMQILVPTDASQIDPSFAGYTIVKIDLEGVDGLPAGLSVNCNSHTADPCTFNAGQVGCGLIEGTPTESGIFPLVINVLPYVDFFGTTIPSPLGSVPFSGYEIVVNSGTGIVSSTIGGISGVRNVPNPFAGRTTIEFNAGKAGNARVRVFNLVGEEIWSELVQSKVGVNRVLFEGGQLPAGVYLYKIESGSKTYTGRMAIQR